jgi:ankyrin repeat protein
VTTLDNLRKHAKRWLKALRDGDLAARDRLRRSYSAAPERPTLRDLQHALARERGFENWTELKAKIDAPRAAAGLPALLAAADRGDPAAAAAILDKDPGIINQRGQLAGHAGLRTALHFGVRHESIVRMLLERGADPNIRDEGDNAFPIHFAAERGELPIVELLIEHGADPIGADTTHELDVLGWAICFAYATHTDVARYLLAHGARHTLLSAVAMGDVDAIRRVAHERADINQRMDRTNHRRTPLHLAIVKKQPHSLAALLELGADPSLEDAAGLTPLDQAALAGENQMTQQLLDHGAAVRLASAIVLERHDDLDQLLRANPDLLWNNRLWARLLVRASSQSSGRVVEALLRAATRHRAGLTLVNMEDDEETAVDEAKGYTPLHAAAAHGNSEAAAVLLKHGANPRVRDGKYCATPAGWARYGGHTATCDLILQAEIDLFDAIDADRGDRVAQLLDRDPGAIDRPFKAYAFCPSRDDQWWPEPDCVPLQWARDREKPNAARVLIERGAAARTSLDIEHAERVVTFLQSACWDHHVHGKRDHRMHDRAAQRLLARHPEIARDNIHAAVVCGNLPEVRLVLDQRPEAARERGGARSWTPILTLCYTRFTHQPTHESALAIARLLLDHGANPNDFYMAMDSAYTALVGVAGEGEQEAPRQPYAEALFELLLERGAEPFDIQVLYNTHFSGDMLWWLELVYKHTVNTPRGAAWKDPEWTMFDMGGYGSGARFFLEFALKKRNLELARWVLAHGASPNVAPARDKRFPKVTLYQEALRQGFGEMADLLLRYGAAPDPDAAAFTDEARFIPACFRLDRDEVGTLFDRHPEFRQQPDAMFAAAQRDRPDVAALLLDFGVSPEVRDANNERPLHRAAVNDALAVAKLLLERGAEIDPRESRYDATPIGWASHADHAGMVTFLSRFSRDFRTLCFTGCVDRVCDLLAEEPGLAGQVDEEGITPLWWLPEDEAKAMQLVERLLAAGADPSVKSKDGRTAADWAGRRGMNEVAARLGATGP